METLLQDVRYSLRVLRTSRGFTVAAILALALGIGANTAIFSVVQAVLWRPLPYDQPEQLVSLWETDTQRSGKLSLSAGDFADWRAQNQVCAQMAMFDLLSVNLTGRDEPERIPSVAASANLFQLLGAPAKLGRAFLPDEDTPGGPRVVVLSYGLWQRRFGADLNIIGQTLTLNGVSRTVIGVMPPEFQFPLPNMTRGFGEFTGSAEMWLPLVANPASLTRGNYSHAGLARLKPGVTLQQAQAEFSAISRRLEEQYPDSNTHVGAKLVPLHQQVVGDVRSSLLVLFGLVPALQASQPDLNASLKEGSRSTGDGLHRQRFRRLLVVSEVALALMLLIGAGLMVKSFWRLQQVDAGFQRERVMTAQLSLPAAKYREQRQWAAFYQQTLERAAALPGVQFAGMVSHLPLSGNDAAFSFAIEGHPPSPTEPSPAAKIRAASPDYFRAMNIPLRAGRQFTDRDTEARPRVLIINEEMARRDWPGEDPLGKRISFDFEGKGSEASWLQIVGVVKGVRHSDLQTAPGPQMYVPYQQLCTSFMSLVIRTQADPATLTIAVRNAVHEVDQDQPLYNLKTMEQLASDAVAKPRFTMLALTIFAGLALLLAAVGIYGVMSYLVAQRTREIGIRMALGAQVSDVLKFVVGQGMKLALAGVMIGLIAAFALTRLMATLLYEVSPTDPVTFAVIASLLAGVALLACYIPARRAMKVDPMIALRYE